MKNISCLLLCTALAMPLIASGCASHQRVVYTWGPGETVYYSRWERDTHRGHMDWERRNQVDQRAYWQWRRHHR